jgi:hypothetical protein
LDAFFRRAGDGQWSLRGRRCSSSGQRTDIPIDISLDLVRFFGDNLNDLIDVALSLSGQGGSPRNVSLEATPIIDTPVGSIRYPSPVTIVSRDVGLGRRADCGIRVQLDA